MALDFLVMEYLEGETLADAALSGQAPRSIRPFAMRIEIADALAAAHNAGIIHRDLKPGNVMLTKAATKLFDFGLAKPREQAGVTRSGRNNTGRAADRPRDDVGTLQYMAPEQMEGKEADASSDIFAFGAVLYEMLTGSARVRGKDNCDRHGGHPGTRPGGGIDSASPPSRQHWTTWSPGAWPRIQTTGGRPHATSCSRLKWAGQTVPNAVHEGTTSRIIRHTPWIAATVLLAASLLFVVWWLPPPDASAGRRWRHDVSDRSAARNGARPGSGLAKRRSR